MAETYAKIIREIANKYYDGNESNATKDANIAYNLYKLYENNPDQKPKILLAFAPAIPLGIEGTSAISAAIAWLVAWKASNDAREISKLVLDGDEQKNYDDLYKQRYGYGKSTISRTHDAIDFDGLDQDDDSTLYKKKHSKKSQRTAFFKDTAISPMPDPGDLEPDDDERDFDITKKENHDKVRRDERFGKLYRDAKDKNTWYSKERSGDRAHGGEHWKRFRQVGEDFFHDVDMTGKVMNKHKSNTGIRIKLKDTIGIK